MLPVKTCLFLWSFASLSVIAGNVIFTYYSLYFPKVFEKDSDVYWKIIAL